MVWVGLAAGAQRDRELAREDEDGKACVGGTLAFEDREAEAVIEGDGDPQAATRTAAAARIAVPAAA